MICTESDIGSLVITRVLRVLTVRSGREHWEYENRPSWGLVIRCEGRAVFHCNGKEYVSDPHNVILLPKGCSYSFDVPENGSYILLEFEANNEGRAPLSFPIDNVDRFAKPLRRLEYDRIVGKPNSALEQMHATYEILLSLLSESRLSYVQKDKAQGVERVADYIARHYQNDLTLEQLAARCGISVVYFRKLFTRVIGVSPINYLHRVRTARAAELLQEDSLDVSEIAEQVGYSSVYHFSAMFKKYMGMPPSKYRLLLRRI